jgi:hypothetical protein
MESVLWTLSGVVALLLVGPPLVLAGGIVVSLLVGAFSPPRPMITAATFHCPFSRRRVTAGFLTWAGLGRAVDVQTCSAFAVPSQIRCGKACLSLAEVRRGWSPMAPRYSLLSGGVATREAA